MPRVGDDVIVPIDLVYQGSEDDSVLPFADADMFL
jgi:hypothetical protein